MSEAITARSVIELATRVYRSKKRAYHAAAQQLRISQHTPRKLEAGDTPGSFIPQHVVEQAFEVFRKQRIAQIRAEMEQLEAQP